VRTDKEHTTRQVHYRHPPKVAIAIVEYLHLHLQPMSLEPIMALLKEPAKTSCLRKSMVAHLPSAETV
jgi:hypothetical protein